VGRCSELWAPAKLSPHNCTVHQLAPVAQRIEHLTTDQKVGGSSPSGRAKGSPASERDPQFPQSFCPAGDECHLVGVNKALVFRSLGRSEKSGPGKRIASMPSMAS
jgi:hypothetical protein